MEDVLMVMPYSEKWSTSVWDAMEAMTTRDPNRKINIFRVDMTTTPDSWLSNHIESINKRAIAVIADITGVNPNVLIEVGIALALDTPLLLIAQDKKFVPAHLGGRIIEFYDPNDADSLQRLGVNVYLRLKEKLKYLEEKKEEAFSKTQYMVECFSNRRDIHLERYFHDARTRIDILTTNLSFLHEEYGGSSNSYFDEIRNALDREGSRVKVRILTLDPESDFAAKRGRQLGYATKIFRDNLREALTKTREIAEKNYDKTRLEVRTYDDFPNQIMYRIDENIFHCVVAQPTQSRRHLTFKLTRPQQGVDSSFTEHYHYIWSKAI